MVNILVFIAGAMTFLTEASKAKAVVVTILSAKPLASLAMVFAEAGTTKNKSVALAISI